MRTILDSHMGVALNKQVNAEIWSAYLYLSMSYDMKSKGFAGMAHWFDVQAKEEFGHAKRLMEYIVAGDGKVKLEPVAEVQQEWNSPKDAFADTLMHEKVVTEKIHELMDMAVADKDYATQNMLNWFIDEQVEEEDTARALLVTLEAIEGDKAAMYLFDSKLAARND